MIRLASARSEENCRARLVVYGHYWRTGTPVHGLDWTDRTACVDFSVVKGGALTTYWWSGESAIRVENYLQVPTG